MRTGPRGASRAQRGSVLSAARKEQATETPPTQRRDMHWLSPAPAGVAGPAGVTYRRARLKSRLKAERIYLPKEPAGAAIRAPSALDVPADWLEAFQSLVNSAYHSVFTFLVRVERIYSDSWLSSSLAAKLLRGVTRPSADVYSS